MNLWIYSSEVDRLGLKHYFKNGNNRRVAHAKYVTACSQVLPAKVPELIVSGAASLAIPICRGDTETHSACSGSRKLQSTSASTDTSAVASLSFPIHNICVEVCWRRSLLCYSLACALHYISILDVESVLIPLGHIKVQLQVNPMENLFCELCFREVRKNKRRPASSSKSLVFPSEPVLQFISFSTCVFSLNMQFLRFSHLYKSHFSRLLCQNLCGYATISITLVLFHR